jgi:hypothetical protein
MYHKTFVKSYYEMDRSFFSKIKYTWKRFYRIQNVKGDLNLFGTTLLNITRKGYVLGKKLKSELKTHSVLTKLIQ